MVKMWGSKDADEGGDQRNQHKDEEEKPENGFESVKRGLDLFKPVQNPRYLCPFFFVHFHV